MLCTCFVYDGKYVRVCIWCDVSLLQEVAKKAV